MLRENKSLSNEKESLHLEKLSLLKSKDLAEGQISTLSKSLEALQDLKDKENLLQDLKQSLEHQRKELMIVELKSLH
ncbi:hypothetical protein ACFX19_026073 [Malus domestica]